MDKKLEAKVKALRAEYDKLQGRDPNKEIKPKVIYHNSKYQDAFNSSGSVTTDAVANDFWK